MSDTKPKRFYPLEQGDWYVVGGQLVDMNATPGPETRAADADVDETVPRPDSADMNLPEAGAGTDAPGNDASAPPLPSASLPPSPPAGKKPRIKPED